jgi:hypothetical protein
MFGMLPSQSLGSADVMPADSRRDGGATIAARN